MNVIPAIDIRGGRCVRLLQGEFDKETEYSTDPAGIARQFAAMGVQELHLVDLDGARGGRQHNQDIVSVIASESPLSVQLGGGIRHYDTVATWLNNGVARCVIGSAAVTNKSSVRKWLTEFGPERIVLALDVRIDSAGTPVLATHGWEKTSNVSLWDCIESYLASGLQHVLCTDVSRDGALSGPNTGLYSELLRRFDSIRLQASGGVRHVQDLFALRETGAAAAITGRALLDGKLTSSDIQSFLRGE